MFVSLEAVLADISTRLNEAATNRRVAMHCPVVGTADGEMRVMVLRAFEPSAWQLRFHTDARSPKVATIGAGAPVNVLFHDADAALQLRVKGHGTIKRDGPIANKAWANATNYAKRCYLAEGAPGAAVDAPTSGLPSKVEGINPSDEQLVPARENFAVLLVDLHEIDWLHLAHDGHRRAILPLGGTPRWVIP